MTVIEPGRGAHSADPRVPTTGRDPAASTDPDVDHPIHYNSHPSGLETIDLIEHLNLCVGTTIKYLMRADYKSNREQDLAKARWYLGREIDRLTRGGTPSTRAPEDTWRKLITGEPDARTRMIFRMIRGGSYLSAVAILDGTVPPPEQVTDDDLV